MTDETLKQELLDCPFCDGTGKIVVERKEKFKMLPDYIYIPACCICGANLPSQDSKEKAIAAWNRRV